MDLQSEFADASLPGQIEPATESSPAPLHGQDILIVDGDATSRGALSFLLQRSGLPCRDVHDADTARRCIADRRPRLILLDWMLPDVSGRLYLHQLKSDRTTCAIPIIIMSARITDEDKVEGLDSGADDYVTKPIASRELIARIHALLRRVSRFSDTRRTLSMAGLTLDASSHRVLANGRNCPMGPTEYKLLEYFMSHAGDVHSRQRLLDRVWGESHSISVRTVDVYVRRLRRALEPFGFDRFVATVHGAGYRFSPTPGDRPRLAGIERYVQR